MLAEELRNTVLHYARWAQKVGLIVWTQGNFSARDPKSGLIAITPSGMDRDKCQPSDVVIVDLAGNIVDGERKPSSEVLLHCTVYAHREDANGIAHTHSAYATAFAVVGRGIPAITSQLAEAAGDLVPVVPNIRDRTELGKAVVETMAGRSACLLANHGLMALGNTLEAAFSTAWQVEDVAHVYAIALQVGEPKTLPHDDALRIRQFFLTQYGQQGGKKAPGKDVY